MEISALPMRHHNTTAAPPPPNGTESHHRKPPFSMFTHFYWGDDTELLFSGWPGNSSGMYALAIVIVFSVAVLVELFANINLVRPGGPNRIRTFALQTVIHGIRAGLAYMVFLAVMSYNGGVFIAAVVGHAVGYVLFGSPVFKKRSNTSLRN